MTDALQLVAENTGRNGGRHIGRRYIEAIQLQKAETRTETEIKDHMKKILGGLEVNT